MIFQCWASIEDNGPTLKQYWVNASCLWRVHKDIQGIFNTAAIVATVIFATVVATLSTAAATATVLTRPAAALFSAAAVVFSAGVVVFAVAADVSVVAGVLSAVVAV